MKMNQKRIFIIQNNIVNYHINYLIKTMEEKTTMYFLLEFDELITNQENRSNIHYEDNYIWYRTSLSEAEETESWTVKFLENWGLN